MPVPPEDRRRLAEAMERRLSELRLRWVDVAVAGGTNVSVLAALRNGYPKGTKNRYAVPNWRTKEAAEKGLRWQPGSIDAILAGGEPSPLPPAQEPQGVDWLARKLDDHERRLTLLESPQTPADDGHDWGSAGRDNDLERIRNVPGLTEDERAGLVAMVQARRQQEARDDYQDRRRRA